ncbi:hypothetical protein Golomagni_05855 [Golovinomyces magnicellulatus]|nr:hypothetical protein Golomagni_05855 [Golovinomyces magnicellulatus]
MGSLLEGLRQTFPSRPSFTEEHLSDLSEKVYIVTGANTGVGKELAQILYLKNAKVYVAARSEAKGLQAIEDIKSQVPTSSGQLVFLSLDLADLTSVKNAAQEFISQESRLDVLFNNAGVMKPPEGSRSVQGHELQIGVNNVGTFLFTKLLTPLLQKTAKTEPAASVRVVWLSSAAGDVWSPPGGVPMDKLEWQNSPQGLAAYSISKAGNYLQAVEYAKRYADDGIVSVAVNPGNLKSELWRTWPAWTQWLMGFVFYPPKFGAYTELFAGLSPEVKVNNDLDWIVPWGRWTTIRPDLVQATKSKTEGGTGIAKEFWEWNEKQIFDFI